MVSKGTADPTDSLGEQIKTSPKVGSDLPQGNDEKDLYLWIASRRKGRTPLTRLQTFGE
jgi:hypothetical protein